jgi:hypothetical protein
LIAKDNLDTHKRACLSWLVVGGNRLGLDAALNGWATSWKARSGHTLLPSSQGPLQSQSTLL